MTSREVVEIPDYEIEGQAVIAEDPATRQLLDLAQNVARTPSTVLLTGESGAGKEVIARYIHRHSDRHDQPFVGVNCAALPPTLLESELFGHEKGAFSGAIRQHPGLFERASGGTILLDEISEMSLDLQAKLLRVLQERVTYRVGGTQPIELDVRVIATSNRDLKKSVDDGEFRLDLYYRLNVFPMQVPALRERPGDIEPLSLYYLAKFKKSLGRDIRGITRTALRRLELHGFPGNVRELTNALERAVILAVDSTVIDVEHLVLAPTISSVQGTFSRTEVTQKSSVRLIPGSEPLTDVRMKVILGTLDRFDGNRTRTAEALGVSIRTIRNKIRDYRERGKEIPD